MLNGNDTPHSTSESSGGMEPVAIVSMACRWPGGVSSAPELWEMLKEGRSGFSEFPKERFNIEGFYHPDQHRPGSCFTRGGFLVNDDVAKFDHKLFGINAVEARNMDPAQRMLLAVTYEAFEQAGAPLDKVAGSRTGVYVGNFNADYLYLQLRDPDHALPYATTGTGVTILSNRISYAFDLMGPSVTVDTACSSGMYALNMAVSSIRGGECDAAVVCGSNLILDPTAQMWTSKLGALSPTSVCHTFDAAADGYARADGFGALYVMRLDKAMAEKYPIRAVIRGIATNANGRGHGITHPGEKGQAAVIRQAYLNAGLNPADTGYFECHGTGTPVGDPIEVAAIGSVFAQHHQTDRLHIGSVKPNLGHSESASAMASIMKVVLAMEHGEVPPTIGVNTPNPNIDFDGARVHVVTKAMPWPTALRRASINSFGYGGANAHVILEHGPTALAALAARAKPRYLVTAKPRYLVTAPPVDSSTGTTGTTNGVSSTGTTTPLSSSATSRNENNAGTSTPVSSISSTGSSTPVSSISSTGSSDGTVSAKDAKRLLVFTAHDKGALRANVQRLLRAFSSSSAWQARHLGDADINDVAYTLAVRRTLHKHRAFLVASGNQLAAGVDVDHVVFADGAAATKRLCFVFTGQGAQWAAMGASLYETSPTFTATIDRLDDVLGALSNRPSWRIADVLQGREPRSINEPEISQTVCTALQIGLVDLLSSWGLTPDAVVGHSSGEMAAAYTAGRISAAEAVLSAYFRGCATSTLKREGAMIAVGLGADHLKPYLDGAKGRAGVAAYNSPSTTTVSGDVDAVDDIKRQLDQKAIFCRKLPTGNMAYHSHHMAEIGPTYEQLLTTALAELSERIQSSPPRQSTPLWSSSVHGGVDASTLDIGPSYWRRNLESPVRFFEAVESLFTHGSAPDTFVELGPHPALHAILKQIFKSPTVPTRGDPVLLATLKRNSDSAEDLLELGGRLFSHHCAVDLLRVNEIPNGAQFCRDLPSYVYADSIVPYHESRMSREFRSRKHLRHDLLGARRAGGSRQHPSWRNVVILQNTPWLRDHKLGNTVIFPAAGYLSMAIEAMRQLHLETDGSSSLPAYCLRNVAINTALELPDDDLGLEMVLHMQKRAITTSSTSRWYDFQVLSSRVGNEDWTENCNGQISIQQPGDLEYTSDILGAQDLVSADEAACYEAFSRLGLVYGHYFQALSEMRVSKTAKYAQASLDLRRTADSMTQESMYAIHPTALDAALQLALAASHGGDFNNARSAYVPVAIDSMTVHHLPGEETALAVARGEPRGPRGLYASIQARGRDGKPYFEISSLRCVAQSLPSGQNVSQQIKSTDPFSRLVWKPDFDTLRNEDARALFPPPGPLEVAKRAFQTSERLASFILMDIVDRYPSVASVSTSEALQKFLSWAHRWCNLHAANSPHGPEARATLPAQRHAIIDELFAQLEDVVEARIIQRIYKNLPAIITGEKDSLELLLADDLLKDLYSSGVGFRYAYPQFVSIVDLLAHKNPRSKVVEIGAGTGGATRLLMQTLQGTATQKRYDSYTFTDVTAAFLASAQDEFASCKAMEYKTLDIEVDPTLQGFAQDYDIAIASQVLHATSVISETLRNVRSLLRPGAKLVLLELTHTHLATGLLLGTLPDFWKGEQDGRIDGPLMNRETWDAELRKAGFSGIDIVLDDFEGGFETASVIVTTALARTNGQPTNGGSSDTVFVLTDNVMSKLAQDLAQQLTERGLTPKTVTVAELHDIPSAARVISLLDVEGKVQVCEEQRVFEDLKELLRNEPALTWVSSPATGDYDMAKLGLMSGFLPTISHELPNATISQLVFEKPIASGGKWAELVVEHSIQSWTNTSSPEQICVVRNGVLNVSRICQDLDLNTMLKAQGGLEVAAPDVSLEEAPIFKLTFDQPGVLSSMYFEEDRSLTTELPDDEIEVRVTAMGLNMKDIAVAIGKFDWPFYSAEVSGVVHRVGSSVKHLKVGDCVAGFVPSNFGNFVRCRATIMQKFDAQSNMGQLASVPVASMTAVYALNRLARLQRGESVLIMGATGALGLALIHLAQHVGAIIYTTAGTPEKVDVLATKFSIPRAKIFNSRDGMVSTHIMQATKGNGIDVIVSTTAGDQMHELWRCVAPLGRFIEVSRTDVIGKGKLAMEVFERNATFSSFDIGLLNKQRPDVMDGLMAEAADLVRSEILKPAEYLTSFTIDRLDEAMMFMGKGNHMGKVVIDYTDPNIKVKVRTKPPQVVLDSEAAYLLVGSSGGVGAAFAQWMIDHGAKNLIFLSRRGANASEANAALDSFRSQGVNVDVKACDVISKESVRSIVKASSAIRPIKGVLQGAMVLQDVLYEKMEFAQLQSVLGPKVQGTINLHEATLDQPLDFFLMMSSSVPLVGTATQSAYSAANSFQDAFAIYRRSLGLPATSLALGMVSDVGFASARPEIQRSLTRNGIYGTPAAELVKWLDVVLTAAATGRDSLAHVVCGLEPKLTYQVDPERKGQDFLWSKDARFSQIMQSISDHHVAVSSQGGLNGGPTFGGDSLENKLVSLAKKKMGDGNGDGGANAGAGAEAELQALATKVVAHKLSSLLFLPEDQVDAHVDLQSFGIDSMMSTELRNWLSRSFGVGMTFTELIMKGVSAETIGKRVVEGLFVKKGDA